MAMDTKQWGEARAYLEQAAISHPEDVHFRFLLGEALLGQGEALLGGGDALLGQGEEPLSQGEAVRGLVMRGTLGQQEVVMGQREAVVGQREIQGALLHFDAALLLAVRQGYPSGWEQPAAHAAGGGGQQGARGSRKGRRKAPPGLEGENDGGNGAAVGAPRRAQGAEEGEEEGHDGGKEAEEGEEEEEEQIDEEALLAAQAEMAPREGEEVWGMRRKGGARDLLQVDLESPLAGDCLGTLSQDDIKVR